MPSIRQALGKFPPMRGGQELDRDIAKFGSVHGVRKASLGGVAFYAVEPDASDEELEEALLSAIRQNNPIVVKIGTKWRAFRLNAHAGTFG